MHTRRVTHGIVWCTAECNWDLLWAWESMPACTKHVHNKQISWSITLVWDCYKNGGRNPTVFLDHSTMDFPQIFLYTNLTNFFWSQKERKYMSKFSHKLSYRLACIPSLPRGLFVFLIMKSCFFLYKGTVDFRVSFPLPLLSYCPQSIT